MTYLILTSLILGLIFLVIEAIIPGFGFFGISGFLLLLISSITTITSVKFGFLIVFFEVIFISLLIYYIFKYMRKGQFLGRIILDETLNYEEKEVGGTDYFLGKEGITKTPLRPFGSANFNGVVMEVYSDGAFIKEKTRIKVIEVTTNKIIVTELLN